MSWQNMHAFSNVLFTMQEVVSLSLSGFFNFRSMAVSREKVKL